MDRNHSEFSPGQSLSRSLGPTRRPLWDHHGIGKSGEQNAIFTTHDWEWNFYTKYIYIGDDPEMVYDFYVIVLPT